MKLLLLTALSTLALAGTALADDSDIVRKFEYTAEPGWRYAESPHQTQTDDPAKVAAACRAEIAAGNAAGFKPDKKLSSSRYKYIPGAVKTDRGSPPQYEITWAQAPLVCVASESALRLSPLGELISKARQQIGTQDDPYLKTGAPSNAVRWNQQGQECLAAVDAALAGGVKADDLIRFTSETLTVAAARTEVCQALIDYAAAYPGWVEAAKKGDIEANTKPWRDAGFKGERLATFAERGPDVDGWYVAGCKEPKSRAQLKTAKVVFQWFYPPDGGHMIRKFTFKGDKLASVTERSFLTEASAYRGCK